MKCKICNEPALPSSDYCPSHYVEDFTRRFGEPAVNRTDEVPACGHPAGAVKFGICQMCKEGMA